jgi:hypothetical protein
MNIATINEILFPFALFFGYFCLACLLVPKQRQAMSADRQAANPIAEIKRAFSAEFDPEPLATLKVKNDKSKVKNEDLLLPFDFCLLTSPKGLPLRQARKVARALGIKQKVNGKDKPVKFLRAEIKQRLKEEPTLAETIQAALAA